MVADGTSLADRAGAKVLFIECACKCHGGWLEQQSSLLYWRYYLGLQLEKVRYRILLFAAFLYYRNYISSQ